jgi:4-hydroxythreonine-4-phosphate dehydrogenase
MSEKPIVVGITQGDTNGIGYEVIIKGLRDSRMMEIAIPLVYGHSKAASYHRKLIKNSGDFSFHTITQPNHASAKLPNLLTITEEKEFKIEMGVSSPIAGKMAFASLQRATNHILEGKIDVLVTAPLNKHTVPSDSHAFVGHTEYLAQKANCANYLMLMITDNLKMGMVTTHCALSEVPNMLKKELILKKLRVFNESLQHDFLYTKPKIAVLALNPHAGENGMFGKEEQQAIIPAVQEALKKGMYVFGPYAADGFFSWGQYQQFDGVLAMYHDQAMMPFKILSCGTGVNYTAGLPFVRTSPAHGTAYDIAGKDMASSDSFRNAIYWACDIFCNRKKSHLEDE